MMLYSEKVKRFTAAHPCKNMTVDGAQYRYILHGKDNGRTLVFLNGGMNTLEMWMDYVDALAEDCRVLLFDYPQELRTNQALVVGMPPSAIKRWTSRTGFYIIAARTPGREKCVWRLSAAGSAAKHTTMAGRAFARNAALITARPGRSG